LKKQQHRPGKINCKTVVLLFGMFLAGMSVSAQKRDFSAAINIGYALPTMDYGNGFYIGFNPCWSFTSHLAIEGQISYTHTKIKKTFLSGEHGTFNSFNILFGGRLYVLSEEKKVRPYINLLAGGVIYNEEISNGEQDNYTPAIGLSLGAFVKITRFQIGLSYDTPYYLNLKIGYIF
jgi:hypothetical protein